MNEKKAYRSIYGNFFVKQDLNECMHYSDILIDGAHIEAYLALMAHEITKQQRQNPHLSKDDPRVILNKHILENSIRQTNILVTGKVRIKTNDNTILLIFCKNTKSSGVTLLSKSLATLTLMWFFDDWLF